MATYIAKFTKGGNTISVEIEAKTQPEAKKVAENMCKTIYPDRRVQGMPQQKR